jgi:hypothetical protein
LMDAAMDAVMRRKGVCVPGNDVMGGREGRTYLRLQNLVCLGDRQAHTYMAGTQAHRHTSDGRGRIHCPRNSTRTTTTEAFPASLADKQNSHHHQHHHPIPCHPAAHHTLPKLPKRINVKQQQSCPQPETLVWPWHVRLQPLSAPRTKLGVCISLALSLCSVLCALCSVQCSLCSVHTENNCLCLL